MASESTLTRKLSFDEESGSVGDVEGARLVFLPGSYPPNTLHVTNALIRCITGPPHMTVSCPQTVLSQAAAAQFWASEFATILRPQKIGILGKAGFSGRQRKRVSKHMVWYGQNFENSAPSFL
jgi:hypothetical protein